MVELTSKVNRITEQYLERFGKVRIATYHFTISPNEPLSCFLNSLMITLRRKDLMPCCAWFSTAIPENRFLILWCNGYFKTDLSDVTPIVTRIGTLHSLQNISLTDCIIGDVSSCCNINSKLNDLITWNYSQSNQFHQRSFGTSAAL